MPNFGTDPDPEFEEAATRWRERMLATLMTDHCAFYNATIRGVPVTILGFATDPANPMAELKPVAIEVTEALFDLIDIEGRKHKG